jgi:hypothetical protein
MVKVNRLTLIRSIVKEGQKQEPKQETSKTINDGLFNQKITFDFLKSHLWAAAEILRGSLDLADYCQQITSLLLRDQLIYLVKMPKI